MSDETIICAAWIPKSKIQATTLLHLDTKSMSATLWVDWMSGREFDSDRLQSHSASRTDKIGFSDSVECARHLGEQTDPVRVHIQGGRVHVGPGD